MTERKKKLVKNGITGEVELFGDWKVNMEKNWDRKAGADQKKKKEGLRKRKNQSAE